MSDNVVYTFAHFQKIAEENRFPENASIPHDSDRCLICHPEKIPGDVQCFCVDLIVACILKRRPRLDHSLVDAINEELQMIGEEANVVLDDLQSEKPEAVEAWRKWAWESINTGLEMLSMHSDNAPYVQLEDLESAGKKDFIEQKLQEFYRKQKTGG